jgi:effector-binding domain-containing protein
MRKKIIIGVIVVLVVVLISLFLFMPKGPDLKAYEFLKEPRITTLPDERMLVVTAQGDPNQAGNKAFSLLFKTYNKIPDVPKAMLPAPRARWEGDMNIKSSWTGYYALPIPDKASSLPALDAGAGLKVELTTWKYGEVAEILHVGPYGEETPTIERLHLFIKQQGFRIIGEHEEEYIKGPGMLFAGDPKGYYTIIRYRIAKS